MRFIHPFQVQSVKIKLKKSGHKFFSIFRMKGSIKTMNFSINGKHSNLPV